MAYKDKEKQKEYFHNWYIEHKEIHNQKEKDLFKTNPEYRILHNINSRCYNTNNNRYSVYGERGIENFLRLKDICYLMKKYNYWELKKPSIDRIDNDKHYTRNNCRFIENEENVSKAQSVPVLQYDLEGNFIKEWSSLTEAAKGTKQTTGNICYCLKGITTRAGQFRWRYK